MSGNTELPPKHSAALYIYQNK